MKIGRKKSERRRRLPPSPTQSASFSRNRGLGKGKKLFSIELPAETREVSTENRRLSAHAEKLILKSFRRNSVEIFSPSLFQLSLIHFSSRKLS